MKLSTETLSVLRNFAMINPNLVFKPDQPLTTISEMKNLMASVSIEEKIPLEFGIYDLNSFLSVVSMFEKPELVFDGAQKVKITEAGSRNAVNYFFAPPSNLTTPSKAIQLPSEDAIFNFSKEDLSNIRKAAATLKVKDLVIEGTTATLCDLKDKTANSFELQLNDKAQVPAGAKIVFNIDNLKLLPGGYGVIVSKKLLAKFVQVEEPGAVYFVAVERTSKF